MGKGRRKPSFIVDNPRFICLFSGFMAEPEKKLVSRSSLAVDGVLVVAFFLFMYWVTSSHVPSHDPAMIHLWGAVTSSCLSAIFWLALQMFRVTLAAQRKAGKK
jgi:hypothetical protein